MAEADDDPVVLEPPPKNGKTKNAAEQFARNMEIVADRARGDTWPVIADRYGLTVRRCKAIMAEFRATNPTLRHSDPVEIVDELLEGMRVDLADLNAIAAGKNTPPLARLGAINSRRALRRDIADLLQQTGTLPNDLGTLTVNLEVQVVVSRIIAILDRFKVPEAVEDAILEEVLGGEVPSDDMALTPP